MKTKKLSFRVSDSVYEKVMELSDYNRKKLSEYLRDLIEKDYQRHKIVETL